ncbi:MAG: hypothetical protein ACO23H_06180 [Alphaproteobacteria bacterium]
MREKSPPAPQRGQVGRTRGGQGQGLHTRRGGCAGVVQVSDLGGGGGAVTHSLVEHTNAGDVVAEPLAGASRCAFAGVDALWSTGLLCEGTKGGGGQVVKGAGDGAVEVGVGGVAESVALLIHNGGSEAGVFVGGVPVITVGEAAEGLASLLLGGVGARLALVVKHTLSEPCRATLDGVGDGVALGQTTNLTAVLGDGVTGGVEFATGVVALARRVGEGKHLGEVGVGGLVTESIRRHSITDGGRTGLLAHDGDHLDGDGTHLVTGEGGVGLRAVFGRGREFKRATSTLKDSLGRLAVHHAGEGAGGLQGQDTRVRTATENRDDTSHNAVHLDGEGGLAVDCRQGLGQGLAGHFVYLALFLLDGLNTIEVQ